MEKDEKEKILQTVKLIGRRIRNKRGNQLEIQLINVDGGVWYPGMNNLYYLLVEKVPRCWLKIFHTIHRKDILAVYITFLGDNTRKLTAKICDHTVVDIIQEELRKCAAAIKKDVEIL